MDKGFGKQYRLLKTEDFSSVFALKKQQNSPLLHILRSQDNGLGHARLGLVVGKKAAKRANKRNYMKRCLREWFRRHRSELPPRDYIIRVRRSFGRDQSAEVSSQLRQLLLRK
ncbi:MAG: ribonuclease P protein component [Neisseria sp.]|nr:ribonuclease P protein component [Neisseria sp.]